MNDIGQQSTHVSHRWERKGIKKYGKISAVAMLKKYKQLYNLTGFGTQDPEIMSRKELYRAIRSINLIKEK